MRLAVFPAADGLGRRGFVHFVRSGKLPSGSFLLADECPKDCETLWTAIEMRGWRDTPCTLGRAAQEEDIREGRAVFYVNGPSEPVDIALPHCALLHDEDGQIVPVIVIQAESTSGGAVAGYRLLRGGNGICAPNELELLDGPDSRFH